MHLQAVLVHPLDSLCEVEIQRKRIGGCGASHFDLRLRVALGRPVRVHVDGDGPHRRGVRWTRLPRGTLLRERAAEADSHHGARVATALQKSAAVHGASPSVSSMYVPKGSVRNAMFTFVVPCGERIGASMLIPFAASDATNASRLSTSKPM